MTRQQILIIGGGATFANYNDYLHYLKHSDINLERLKNQKNWKDDIDKKLGKKFEVFIPKMPNKANAQYQEWKIIFEKILPLLKNNLILIGHSLGGIFLAKYLSQNNISSKIKSLILISAPFDEEGTCESLGNFKLNSSLVSKLNCYKQIYLIHSQDDQVVPFCQVKKCKSILPKAKLISFKNKGHFNQPTFPKLIKIIKQI